MTNGPLLHFVIIAGLLDSFNPCAIAVLLIFIALMFTLRKSRSTIFVMGTTYIIAVYLTYLAIGLGLLKVINLFGIPHLFSRIGAWAVILIGVWGHTIKESPTGQSIYTFKDMHPTLSLPAVSED